jgi:hypothetical protein
MKHNFPMNNNLFINNNSLSARSCSFSTTNKFYYEQNNNFHFFSNPRDFVVEVWFWDASSGEIPSAVLNDIIKSECHFNK